MLLAGLIAIPVTHGEDLAICIGMMLCGLFIYGVHTSLANGSLCLSARGLRYLFATYYLMFMVFVGFSPDASGPAATANQKQILAAQFAAVVCFVDSRVHVPGQMAMFVFEAGRYFALRGWDSAAAEFLSYQFVCTMLIIAASVVHEDTLRERLSAQFRHVDAESMISSFRTLLRGICDGEILLDENMRIQDGGTGLNRLLETSGSLEGREFEEVLVQDADEKDRFHNFISTGEPVVSGAPPCLRVSLRPSGRLGVDLFHVAVPHLYGCKGAYHLLAMKLDAEYCAMPEAPACVPEIPTFQYHKPFSSRAPGSRRSDRSGGSLLHTTPHLKEIMLLVDASNRHAVQQVHLSYQDRKRGASRSERDSPKSSRECMPALRDFIRPTEWGTVQRKVQKYVARCDNSSEVSLGHIWIKMFDRASTYILARRTKLKPRASGDGSGFGQLWLHLKDFTSEPAEQGIPSELEYIGEAGACESDPDPE